MAESTAKSGRSLLWLLPLLAIGAGVGAGAATTLTTYRDPVMDLPGHEATANKVRKVTDAKPIVDLPAPKVHNFGIMARGDEQSHSFKISNIGGGPLTLTVKDTTCKCTVGALEKDSIEPGETVDVTLTWVARSYDREFRQSATIETSDQSQREVIFSVFGQVKQLALPDRPLVTFNRALRSEEKQFETTVYAYRDTDFAVVSHDFSDEETADFFEVTTERLPEGSWAETGGDEVKSATKVTVKIKPGLPVGVVRQIISLNTNKHDIAPMDVAVDMTVVSDISAHGGREFNDETNVLRLGPVSKADGRDYSMNLFVKGKFKDQVEFSVREIDPSEALEAVIGEPVEYNKGKGLRVPLTVRVKPNSPNVSRTGSKQSELGSIILDTHHPDIDQFKIRVQFTVQ